MPDDRAIAVGQVVQPGGHAHGGRCAIAMQRRLEGLGDHLHEIAGLGLGCEGPERVEQEEVAVAMEVDLVGMLPGEVRYAGAVGVPVWRVVS